MAGNGERAEHSDRELSPRERGAVPVAQVQRAELEDEVGQGDDDVREHVCP